MSGEQIIVLQSFDGHIFEIEESAAMLSNTIGGMIEEDCASTTIPIPNVAGRCLAKVIEYCKYHAANQGGNSNSTYTASSSSSSTNHVYNDSLKAFDDEFVKVDQDMLYEMIMAANYLNIKSLLDLICQTVADMIKGKTPEQIRTHFKIVNDFTPEEEEEIRRENAWAFE